MNIVYISKYIVLPECGSPTRQYFLGKYLSKISNNKVLLVGSRSSISNIPSFNGLYHSTRVGNFETVTLNGPRITLGFNLKRIWSWIIFEMNIFRFRKKIKAFKPDITIVSSLSILTFLSGIFFKKWLRIPLVIEVRDLYPLTLQEVGRYSSWNPFIMLLKWVEKTGYKNADFIISSLPNASEHIFDVVQKPFKFEWIPMGIDEEYFNERTNGSDFKYLSNSPEFIVGYAGTIGKANALDIVFETARKLELEYPHIKFLFVGDGPHKPFFINKYGYLKNVRFMGAVTKKELQTILRETDILVNSWLNKGIYRFGISPNKWIDYMYAEKPILVSYSGYKCILEEAECGLFTPAEDVDSFARAIVKLSKMEKKVLHKMGMNGKHYLLNHLSYTKLAEQLHKILLSVIEKK